jgi:hypothetical protein
MTAFGRTIAVLNDVEAAQSGLTRPGTNAKRDAQSLTWRHPPSSCEMSQPEKEPGAYRMARNLYASATYSVDKPLLVIHLHCG